MAEAFYFHSPKRILALPEFGEEDFGKIGSFSRLKGVIHLLVSLHFSGASLDEQATGFADDEEAAGKEDNGVLGRSGGDANGIGNGWRNDSVGVIG